MMLSHSFVEDDEWGDVNNTFLLFKHLYLLASFTKFTQIDGDKQSSDLQMFFLGFSTIYSLECDFDRGYLNF